MFFLQFSQAEEQYDVGQVGIFMMISFAKVCLLCSFPIARPPRQYTGLPGRLMTGRVGRQGSSKLALAMMVLAIMMLAMMILAMMLPQIRNS